jgi:hypothetical protein
MFKRKNKNIFKIEPYDKNIIGTTDPIKPSKFFIPEWYKNMSRYMSNNKNPISTDGLSNRTVKSCIPFLDSLTAGYMITLPYDIFITRNPEYKYLINWSCDWEVVSKHDEKQFPIENIPEEFEKLIFKWNNPWLIKTPPGWSTLFVHPLNRFDLPFLTLSGIVDTDNYEFATTNFPFFIKKDFEGIIKHNTPIAQAIPIKRSNWKIKELDYSEKDKKTLNYLRKNIIDSYKKQFWFRKEYS